MPGVRKRRRTSWVRKTYPSSSYYRRYYKRTPASRKLYGGRYKKSTTAQRAARKRDAMYGMGIYTGGRRYGRGRYSKRRRMRGRGIYTGRGGFKDWAKKAWDDRASWLTPSLDAIQSAAWEYAPGWATGPIDRVRDWAKSTGIGQYTVNNALVNSGKTGTGVFEVPTFTPISDTGAITLSNREFIGNLYAPGTDATIASFAPQRFSINPGLMTAFPWLSALAKNYSSYELKQCVVSYKSLVTQSVTDDGRTGTVAMAFQGNSYECEFDSMREMIQTHGSATSKTTDNLVLGVECNPAKTPLSDHKFLRHQDIPSGRDPNDFDHGVLTVATSDCPAKMVGQRLGEIWITYTVTLYRPKVEVGTGSTIAQDRFVYMCQTDSAGAPSPATAGEQVLMLSNDAAATTKVDLGLWPLKDLAVSTVYANVNNGINCLVEGISCDGGTPATATGKALWADIAASKYELIGGALDSSAGIRSPSISITFPGNFAGDVMITYQALTNRTIKDADQTGAVNLLAGFTNNAMLRQAGNDQVNALEDIACGFDGVLNPAIAGNAKKIGLSCFAASFTTQNAKGTTAVEMRVGIEIRACLSIKSSSGGKDNKVILVLCPLFRDGETGSNAFNPILASVLQASITISLHNATVDCKRYGTSYRNDADQYVGIMAQFEPSVV